MKYTVRITPPDGAPFETSFHASCSLGAEEHLLTRYPRAKREILLIEDEQLGKNPQLILVLKLVELRIAMNQREFEEALAARQWSELSALHGIGTGLLMTKRILEEQLK